MKVDYAKVKFKPIAIELESLEEVKQLTDICEIAIFSEKARNAVIPELLMKLHTQLRVIISNTEEG